MIILTGCSHFEEDNKDSILTIDPGKETIEPEEIFSEYKFVTIDTGVFIPIISSATITEEFIILVDAYKTETVYFFNKEGRFLHSIKPSGSGANEFESIKCQFVDNENQKVEVLTEDNRLLTYSFDGQAETERILDFSPYSFIKDKEDYFFDLSNEANQYGEWYNIVKINFLTNQREYLSPAIESHRKYTITSDRVFSKQSNHISYISPLGFSILKLEDDRLETNFLIDIKDNVIDNEFLNGKNTNSILASWDEYQLPLFPKLFESDNFYVIQFQIGSFFKGYKSSTIVNKDNLKNISFENFLFDSEELECNIVGTSGQNTLIAYIDAEELNTKNVKIEIQSDLGNNKNPILLIGKLRSKL